MAQFSSKTTPENTKRQIKEPPNTLSKEKKPDEDDMKHPWQTLVSYVDELTVGGRKNSKGQYMDAMGKFPGFGKQKEPKVPQDCFPRQCYDMYVSLITQFCEKSKTGFYTLNISGALAGIRVFKQKWDNSGWSFEHLFYVM